jgi:hypothetical protein
MITLTEKRLQELEHNISVMKAKVEEYDKKISDVFSDSSLKDIENLKSELLKFKSDFISVISRLEGDVRCSLQNSSILQVSVKNHDDALKDAANTFYSLNKSRDSDKEFYLALKSSLSGIEEKYSRDIIDIKNGMIEPKNDIKVLKRLTDVILEKIDSLKVIQCEVDEKLSSESISIAKDLNSKIQANERKFFEVVAALEKKISDTQEKDAAIIESVNIHKDVIKDIKNDIASILTTLSLGVTQKSANDSYGDKVKTMETSIAQIYSLLKKYETRD